MLFVILLCVLVCKVSRYVLKNVPIENEVREWSNLYILFLSKCNFFTLQSLQR